ncbi:Ubiquitin-like modifier-activating enzyme atg-7 [Fusarium oxysporum f. sp. cubense race 1]|uniref:Ubiquitin-like modifier-activating enzyme ATG7 n=1 Tax=Fusarium oxysporum f. sp. cubense (strain race 1) TaxID=1229664 RepID=N4TXV2_FUSC1|nr:Ubiquitin-like modifier-activating enzyme atg-7 [Fusarium oxysporum f. sp. cubense race 1]
MAAPLQFAPFISEIELSFYSALFGSKLEHDKLDDSARSILGLYEPRLEEPESSCRMQILGNALTSSRTNAPSPPLGTMRAEGIIRNVNTLEDFKNTDKPAMLKTAGRQIWDAIKDGSIYSVPSLLSSFIILSYADLKKYKFTYWFAFPALHSDPSWKRSGPAERLNSKESTALVDRVGTWRYSVDSREHGFFLAKKVHGEVQDTDDPDSSQGLPFRWEVASLREFENGFFDQVAEEDRYVAFVDPSTYPEGPGWPLRNFLVLIRQRFHLTKTKVICYRDIQAKRHEARSVILPIEMDPVENLEITEMPKVTGWARSSNGKLQAQQVNLGEYMDPARQADGSVDLNLKLMKWRIAPELDLDAIKNTKCLLLGADESKTREEYEKLEKLIDEHDAIFLLMDSRESRWLPTVMGKAKGKIVMNAALGFDSYVVMRHGSESHAEGQTPLGCYFCNDVVAPADSQKDQTLDQQCTVTRPGVAAIASALLVELLTSLLQHPLGKDAPAPQPTPGVVPERDPPEHPLGLVPHQIRGYVSTFQNIVIRGQSYDCCSACSPKILDAYRNDGWGFVKKALQEKDYVAELSGLAEVQRRAEEMAAQVDWEEDDDLVEDGDGELI